MELTPKAAVTEFRERIRWMNLVAVLVVCALVGRLFYEQVLRADVRIVAAANVDLAALAAGGGFRADLLDRLAFDVITLPPLRARPADILDLAGAFGLAMAKALEFPVFPGFSAAAQERLLAHAWPGNVRELESAVEYATLHARGAEIATEDLPPKLQSEDVRAQAVRSPLAALYDDLPKLDELERRYLLHVLEAMGGSRTRAAEVMGIDRRTLYRMAERFGINLDGE